MKSDFVNTPVAFNMDLANGPTYERFCYAAFAVLQDDGVVGVLDPDGPEFQADKDEWLGELVDSYEDALTDNGYCAIWNAGDVVVYDLRGLTDDQREQFYTDTENW
jgi:hypothetical protein